jgi:hypothetical protein
VDSSDASRLSPLQRDVLEAFFERERAFRLTGGGALVGYHLRHRTTEDLDLFTRDPDAFARGKSVLADVATALGGTLHVRQDAPGFTRLVLERAGDGVVVDLVKDVGAPTADPIEIGRIVVDPPAEILANKLTTIVGRAEERDLVDVMFLERAGYSIDSALPVALAKDGGCTPATLAWLLSEMTIPDGISLPANDLVDRLLVLAAPSG